MRGTLSGFTSLAAIVVALGMSSVPTLARACPSGKDAARCGDTPDFLLEQPLLIGNAWRNGRAEVDVGQGMLGQISPEGIEWLADRGIQLFGWYMVAVQGNPVGGLQRAVRYTGLLDFGIDVDLETMAEIKGLWVHVSGSWTSGIDLTADVGAFAPVNAVFSGDTIRLFEMYLEERILDDRLSIRVGRISVGWEYGLEYDYFTQYVSAAFRLNVFALDSSDPNFSVIPFANWGARLRWTPNERWRVQASWMNGFPRDFSADDKRGVDFSFQPTKGSFFILEASYQWVPTKGQRRAKPGRLPGRITFGGYYDTGTFERLDDPASSEKVLGKAYVILRQKVWEPGLASDRGIVLWTAASAGGKQSIIPLPHFWSGGLVWTGPGRRLPDDVLALGFANEFFSKALADQSVEVVLEGAYSFNLTTWLTITPDLQYIIRPSGMKSIDNAFLAGVLLYLTF